MTDEKLTNTPGLLEPVDADLIITPSELCGGDTTMLSSGPPTYINMTGNSASYIGLAQGLSIQSSRMVRSIYEIGTIKPMLVTAKGQKTLSLSAIISEETNLIAALYKYIITNPTTSGLSAAQETIVNTYQNKPIIEGLARDLLRIPFGLQLEICSGAGDIIQKMFLENCMLSMDNSTIDAGGRGIPEGSSISWQLTQYIS